MEKKKAQKGRRLAAVKDERLPPFFNYWMEKEHESHFKGTRLAPWENQARAFADRIRLGTLDGEIGWALQIDRDRFVDLLQELSEAVRSRFDAPSKAAKAALKQISDALLHTGPGRRRKFEDFKFDRLYRAAREALYKEALAFLDAKKETERRNKKGEAITLDEVLKERRRAEPWHAMDEPRYAVDPGAHRAGRPVRVPPGRPVRVLESAPECGPKCDPKCSPERHLAEDEEVDPQWIARELHAYIMESPPGRGGSTIKDRCKQLVADGKTPRGIRRALGLATRPHRVGPTKSHR